MRSIFYMVNSFMIGMLLMLIACSTEDTTNACIPSAVAKKIETSELKKETEVDTNAIDTNFQVGDIIFHASSSQISLAIQLATQSPYSHMGILHKEGDQFYVFEAVQPVKSTPLDQWIARGKNGAYSVKRLKRPLLKSEIQKMLIMAKRWSGKSYDITFNWSDDKMYCSELVWKLYQRGAGVELGHPKALKENDLSHPIVRAALNKVHGKNWPMDMQMISPVAIFDSKKLTLVREVGQKRG